MHAHGSVNFTTCGRRFMTFVAPSLSLSLFLSVFPSSRVRVLAIRSNCILLTFKCTDVALLQYIFEAQLMSEIMNWRDNVCFSLTVRCRPKTSSHVFQSSTSRHRHPSEPRLVGQKRDNSEERHRFTIHPARRCLSATSCSNLGQLTICQSKHAS